LKKNYVDFSRKLGRVDLDKKIASDSVDLNILDKADLKRSHRKKTVAFEFDKLKKRDDKMYNHGEWYKNCSNETKNDLQNKLKQSIKL